MWGCVLGCLLCCCRCQCRCRCRRYRRCRCHCKLSILQAVAAAAAAAAASQVSAPPPHLRDVRSCCNCSAWTWTSPPSNQCFTTTALPRATSDASRAPTSSAYHPLVCRSCCNCLTSTWTSPPAACACSAPERGWLLLRRRAWPRSPRRCSTKRGSWASGPRRRGLRPQARTAARGGTDRGDALLLLLCGRARQLFSMSDGAHGAGLAELAGPCGAARRVNALAQPATAARPPAPGGRAAAVGDGPATSDCGGSHSSTSAPSCVQGSIHSWASSTAAPPSRR